MKTKLIAIAKKGIDIQIVQDDRTIVHYTSDKYIHEDIENCLKQIHMYIPLIDEFIIKSEPYSNTSKQALKSVYGAMSIVNKKMILIEVEVKR